MLYASQYMVNPLPSTRRVRTVGVVNNFLSFSHWSNLSNGTSRWVWEHLLFSIEKKCNAQKPIVLEGIASSQPQYLTDVMDLLKLGKNGKCHQQWHCFNRRWYNDAGDYFKWIIRRLNFKPTDYSYGILKWWKMIVKGALMFPSFEISIAPIVDFPW